MKPTIEQVRQAFDLNGDHWTAREAEYMLETWHWKYRGATMNNRKLRHIWSGEPMPEMLRLALVGKKSELLELSEDDYLIYMDIVRTKMR